MLGISIESYGGGGDQILGSVANMTDWGAEESNASGTL